MLLALGSATCSAFGLITARLGLRYLPVRAGASFSVPCAFVLFLLLSPVSIDWSRGSWLAVGAFALIGLFFPAAVTLLSFASTERYGGPVTGAISGTSPLFALPAAALLLGETVPPHAMFAAAGITVGIAVLSWQQPRTGIGLAALGLPLTLAAIRGLSQVAVKASLQWWSSAFAATLVGYAVSSLILIRAGRRARAGLQRIDWRGIGWFALTGLLNGSSVLLLYWGLTRGSVALIAPVVAIVPLIAILVARVLLPGERLTRQALLGIAITVASVVWLVGG